MISKITYISAVILSMFFIISCTTDEESIINPLADANNYVSVTSFSANKSSLRSNGDSTEIRIEVLDAKKAPIVGLTVGFTAEFGIITNSGITDSEGLAIATFVSDNNIGKNIITADTGVKLYTLPLYVMHYLPSEIELTPATSHLLADGVSTTSIIAVVKDSVGKPMEGESVVFTTTLGTLEAPIKQTDENGIATVELTSSPAIGTATIVASSPPASGTIMIEFFEYTPNAINLTLSEESILADGNSTVEIDAQIFNEINEPMVGVEVLFSTTSGNLIGSATVKTDHDGKAITTLQSRGVMGEDVEAVVVAEVSGGDVRATETVTFRGVSIDAIIDSVKFTPDGYYNTFITANLRESSGPAVENASIVFSPTLGTMENNYVSTNEFGKAQSVLSVMATALTQSNQSINVMLSTAPDVNKTISNITIPGVELLVSTIDDEVMGDGNGWSLVRATLRENTGKAIGSAIIDWETSFGTIIGKSKTTSSGQTVDTLRIESAVSQPTDAIITARFGSNVSVSDVVQFVPPVGQKRLILGFESGISSGDSTAYVPCDTDPEFAIRDIGISALYIDANGTAINWDLIYFSVVPNYFAAICERAYTINGIATVMLAYPLQKAGEVVRVWAESEDGTRGSIDILLPQAEGGG